MGLVGAIPAIPSGSVSESSTAVLPIACWFNGAQQSPLLFLMLFKIYIKTQEEVIGRGRVQKQAGRLVTKLGLVC